MRFPQSMFACTMLAASFTFFTVSGFSTQVARTATLKQPAKFDIVINGAVAGNITVATGTQVVILDEKEEMVLIGLNDSKTWVNRASLKILETEGNPLSPQATPSPSHIVSAIPPTPSPTLSHHTPPNPDSNIVIFKTGQPEHWVSMDKSGMLLYAADTQGNHIPDFSNCGYGGGGMIPPTVEVKATVGPVSGDAGAAIQSAIDKVSALPLDANGFRGTVLIQKGTYSIAEDIHIDADGVVLRGEGQGPEGTVLVAAGKKKRTLIIVGNAGKKVKFKEEESDDPSQSVGSRKSVPVTDSYVPVGAHSFNVSDASNLHVGDHVGVYRPSTQNWIQFLGMDTIPQNKNSNVVQWKPGSKDLCFRRRVVALKGNQVTIEAPLCCSLDKTYGGGQLLVGLEDKAVRHVGFENLRGDSEYNGDTDENHGWVFISMEACNDGWVRDVTSVHFGYSCVEIASGSTAITVQDCTCLDPISQVIPSRRYSFALDGQLCLVLRCHTRNGRHDFVMKSLAPGPNAFVECTSENARSDTGPHERWSVGVLYDNVSVHNNNARPSESAAGDINIRNRGNMGTGHGWAGANQVVWNCDADSINVEQPPTAQNWCIGSRAKTLEGNGYYENKGGFPVIPSLFRAQLNERLGKDIAEKVLGSKKS